MNDAINRLKQSLIDNKITVGIILIAILSFAFYKNKNKLKSAQMRLRAQKQKQKTFNVINRLKRFR